MDGKFVEFSVELRNLINKNSVENGCNTPDFILADFMIDCLHAFEYAVKGRIEWYGDNEVTSEPEIKACPVCGGDNWLMEYERLDGYTMFCQDCFIGLHQYYPTEKECGEAWNALPRKGEE